MKFLKKLTPTRTIMFFSVMITIIAIIVLVTRPSWFFKDLPEENFATLTMTKSFSENCEICEEIGYSGGDILSQSQASGFSFFSKNGLSYILTADHFCTETSSYYTLLGVSQEVESNIVVTDHYGNTWNANVVFTDYSNDLCLLESNMPIENNFRLASKQPEIGEDVFVISAPNGHSDKGISIHIDGKYSGCNPENECAFYLPVYFGSSGSVILNSEGEMISMVQTADIRLKFISFGPTVATMRNFLQRASASTGIDLEF